ncbi:FMN-binding protein [Brachyspira catarrhinii]|uniref:FMN-binding protein n=1 Tax=Brachyspira catarrhinii TaxID=2528966 RepID=A0ABY2TSW1_9SPIR|nr:FMN-binding protein [Brachyspira catarrhinii]TKZ35869.1 FMN-binding protein [Brachyspira catarrhinii]
MNSKKIIISAVAFVFVFALIVFAQAKSKIDLSKIPDGTYLGDYKATYKTVQGDYQARVTVAKGKLTRIVLTKSAHKSGPARSKEAFNKMIEANDIYADGITGATWSALVEDALTKLTPAK